MFSPPIRHHHGVINRDVAARGLTVLAFLLLAAVAVVSLAACRTTEGFGRDVEHLGDNIADSADKHKP